MKTRFFIYLALPLALATAACTDDDSTYSNDSHYIRLGGLEETYSMVSFNGDELRISPTVETSFPADDLDYLWTSYNDVSDDNANFSLDTVKVDTLSRERDLATPINLSDGTYTLRFRVTSKSTGYSREISTTLNTASALSQGFYVLKETTDGNTDVDMYNATSAQLIPDIIQSIHGQSMQGRPRCMDINYQQCYIDREAGSNAVANIMCVTTERNEARFMRVQDFQTVMDSTNYHYDFVAGEVPYRTIRGYFSIYFLTSNGVYNCYTSVVPGSGVIGAFAGDGASTHVALGGMSNFYGPLYWSEDTKSIESVDYNGMAAVVSSAVDGYGVTGLNYDCLFCGHCGVNGDNVYFLFQDKDDNNKKYLYTIAPGMGINEVTDVTVVDAQSHFANARLRAINGQTATIAYAVDGNSVYSYDLAGSDHAEKELQFDGIPSGETIGYVANYFYNGTDEAFDYLVIGTQSDSTYHVYFYNMVGGEPSGKPVMTFSGQGTMKKLAYVNATVSDGESACYECVLDQ